jgi:hypothetical protein
LLPVPFQFWLFGLEPFVIDAFAFSLRRFRIGSLGRR